MLHSKILVSVCAGTIVYVVTSFLGGQNGLWAYKQLENQKYQISIHTAELSKLNDELQLEYTALKQDDDVIAAYARRLGYISEGENIVKISGLAPYYTPIYDSGVVVKRTEISFIPEWICKVFGCITGSLVFLLLMLRLSPSVSAARCKGNRPTARGLFRAFGAALDGPRGPS